MIPGQALRFKNGDDPLLRAYVVEIMTFSLPSEFRIRK
jgi:hypothetical protein